MSKGADWRDVVGLPPKAVQSKLGQPGGDYLRKAREALQGRPERLFQAGYMGARRLEGEELRRYEEELLRRKGGKSGA